MLAVARRRGRPRDGRVELLVVAAGVAFGIALWHVAGDVQGDGLFPLARIRKLEQMLRDPDIVEAPATSDSVTAGMAVTVVPLGENEPEEETYLLATSAEERAPGVRTVTTTSPLGSVAARTRVTLAEWAAAIGLARRDRLARTSAPDTA